MIAKKVTQLDSNDVFRYRGRIYRFDRGVGFTHRDDGDGRTFRVMAWPMATPLRAAGPTRYLSVTDSASLLVFE